MAYRIGFDSSVKTVFLNSVIKNTSKLIQTDQWNQLEESSIMKIYDQVRVANTDSNTVANTQAGQGGRYYRTIIDHL